MLKPIHQADCAPALIACQSMMQKFSFWLCDATVSSVNITEQGLRPPTLNSQIETNWLWNFLQRETDSKQLLERAKTVADMDSQYKTALRVWLNTVTNFNAQFQANPTAWPSAPLDIGRDNWKAYKELMLSFYSKGLHQVGLPYKANGTPTACSGEYLTYKKFKNDFLSKNRIVVRDDVESVCVLCGGAMEQIDVDHWVYEAAYPILSICANNLVPICSTCNKRPNKGTKDVHTNGSFSDWFHPYLRPGNNAFSLNYRIQPRLSVEMNSSGAGDVNKVSNLDGLLNLTSRWTKKFKAEYRDKQEEVRRLKDLHIRKNRPPLTQQDIQQRFEDEKEIMAPHSAHYEVRQLVCDTILEKARLDAWQQELDLE